MSIKNHKNKGIYDNIDRFHRNFIFKENLIKSPLLFSTKLPSYSDNIPPLFDPPLQPNNPLESSYTHSSINYQAPFLKTNNRFFWTMAYETPVESKAKFLGSRFKYKGVSDINSISDEKNRRKTLYFPQRPSTKQRSRCSNRSLVKNYDNETGLFIQKDVKFIPEMSSSRLIEILNYGNEIEEFEYNVPRIVKPTNFIENEECMHGLINLRKKEAILFEKIHENSGRTIRDSISMIEGKKKRKIESVSDIKNQKGEFLLKKAIYEQNFVKSRRLMGKSLQNFKQIL